MNKKVLMLAFALCLMLSAVPFATAVDTAHTVPNWDHMIFASIGEPETVDPAWAYDTASSELIFNVYETLIFWPYAEVPEDPTKFEGHIADQWSISKDGKTYEFRIRSGVSYHDPTYGTVTAEDVEYSIERGMVLDHAGGPYWMLYEPLLGGYNSRMFDTNDDGVLDDTEAAAGGHAIDDAVTTVHNATGDYVVFHLHAAFGPFMQILSQTWASVMPKQWGKDLYAAGRNMWPGWDVTGYVEWREFNQRFTSTPFDVGPLDYPTPVMMGCGPYKFVRWEKENYWEIEAFNPGYWRPFPAAGVADYVKRATHKLVPSWTTRKMMFLSDDPAVQADMVHVPRANIGDVMGLSGIRGVKDLPSLVLSPAAHINYDVSTTTAYFAKKPTLGGATKLDLFSDIHMRKAFAYAFDYDKYLIDAYKGEAVQPSSALIQGLAFWNATKDLGKPVFDIAKATEEFKLAWGGRVWSEGFTVPLTYNSGNVMRKMACDMLKTNIETLIPWPEGVNVELTVDGLPWGSIYIPAMVHSELSFWLIGWIADFAHPHNFVHPYMHPYGDFAYFQNVEYGQADDFHPTSGRHYPYVNALGETVTRINNTYVGDIISEAVATTDPAIAEGLYNELVDIWQAEFVSMALGQPLLRHWERQWTQGWYYNPICQGGWGLYLYHYWKGIDTDMTGRDPTETRPDGTPAPYGYIDIKDKGKLNAYWWDGFTAGTLGYNRVADVWWPGRTEYECREMSGQAYLTGPSPPPDSSWHAFGTPAFADGFVDIYDKARLSYEWHDYVVPNPTP